jgi:hypothetical protein
MMHLCGAQRQQTRHARHIRFQEAAAAAAAAAVWTASIPGAPAWSPAPESGTCPAHSSPGSCSSNNSTSIRFKPKSS